MTQITAPAPASLQPPPPGTTTQVLQGTTLTPAQKWAALHGQQPMVSIAPLDRLFGVIMGKSQTGKSHLLHHCPGALIINLDLASVPIPSQAAIWPRLCPKTNEPLDLAGRPIKDWSWRKIVQMIDQLIADRRSSKPVPSCVAFDTISTPTIMLLQAEILGRINEGLPAESHKRWDELDPRKVYPVLNNLVMEQIVRLRIAGFGVWVVLHLHERAEENENGTRVVTLESALHGSLHHKLFESAEMVVPVACKAGVRAEQITGPNGRPQVVQRSYVDRMLPFADHRFADLKKNRTRKPMETIVLKPGEDPWQALLAAYEEANRP